MNLGIENEVLEFKKSTSELKDAMDDICAMLNKHGYGTLYFGVKPNGDVCGQEVSASSLNDVATFIKTAIKPMIYPQIDKITLEGKDVIKVEFKGNERPYSSYGRYYKRVHDRAEDIVPDELKHMMLNNDFSSIWENNPTPYGLEAVDSQALKSFYNKSVACGRLEPLQEYNEEELLTILGLYKDGKLNNAGFFLFSSKEPTVLKMAVYFTDARLNFSDINRVHGNIYNHIDVATKYISDHMNWRVEFEGKSTARIEIPEVPIEAIRETVVNAFAHANYRSFTEHEISITPTLIEIYNPGEFPLNYKPEDFATKKLGSMPRNKKILDVLYKCKNVEVQGSGLRKVYNACNLNNVKCEYLIYDFGFRFIFHRNNVTVHVTQNVTVKLIDTDYRILNLLKEKPDYTREILANKVGKTVRTVQRSLDKLTQAGKITRIGSDKTGYWEVIE